MQKNTWVEFSKEESCFITRGFIESLIQKALENPLKKYRYCLHQNPESTLHEMVIVTTKSDMKYPDKHMETTESNVILEGKLLVVLFRENGEIQKTFVLEPDNVFYYRCEKNQYHMTIPLSDVAVYIEIKEGPFNEKSNVYPAWAPNRKDMGKLKAFNEKIKTAAMKMLEKGDFDAVLDESGNNNAI